MKPFGQLRDFGDGHRPCFKVFGALAKHPFENKGNSHAAGRHRRRHTPASGYRELQQSIQTAEPAALRLVQELTPEMRGCQVDY
jgi:hypothetical protein